MKGWIAAGALVAVIALAAASRSGTPDDSPAPGVTAAASAAGPRADVTPSARRHRESRDAGLEPLCATLLREEKLDESALREGDATSPGARAHCASDGRVAWMIRADKRGDGVEQTLLFASQDGARARQVSSVPGVEWPPVIARHATLFDFDGDGTPELVATIAKNVRTFEPASRIFATMKKGAIAAYPTGGKFLVEGAMDFDHDGRPDLRVSFDLGKGSCGGDRPVVERVAHALPGGRFSLDDAAALGIDQRRCESLASPDGMFTPAVGAEPADLSLAWIACERLRGKTADAVVDEVRKACEGDADAVAKCAGRCRRLPDALAVARFDLPR